MKFREKFSLSVFDTISELLVASKFVCTCIRYGGLILGVILQYTVSASLNTVHMAGTHGSFSRFLSAKRLQH